MDNENHITGPGYYPRRPSTRPVVHGKPFVLRVIDTRNYCWDSAYFDERNLDKPAHFEIEIISPEFTIVSLQVHDAHDEVLYTQKLDKPVYLRELYAKGKHFTCDIDVAWRP